MTYEERLKKFNSFYLTLVISVGVVIAAAVALAVFFRVSVGLLAGICGVLIYVLLLSDEMKGGLGLWYRRTTGGIACSVVASRKLSGQRERYLPKRLMWLDVVELCGVGGKDKPDTEVEVIHLPSTVEKISTDAFLGMSALCKIVFCGSAEQWERVECLADLSGIELEIQNSEAEV